MFVYKPCGIEGSYIADSYKKQLNKKKVCLCGKLDIMAEGLLQLLFDEDCKNMKYHLNHNKVYRFKILWGIQTDTSDYLGLICNIKNINHIEPPLVHTVKPKDVAEGLVFTYNHWISLYGLVNNAMSFNFKLSFTSDYPTTNITAAQTDQGSWIRNPWVSKNQFDYKIQVDYAF